MASSMDHSSESEEVYMTRPPGSVNPYHLWFYRKQARCFQVHLSPRFSSYDSSRIR
ncbi:hypothetical protein ACE6H2_023817 [Prunus campanulata]